MIVLHFFVFKKKFKESQCACHPYGAHKKHRWNNNNNNNKKKKKKVKNAKNCLELDDGGVEV
jgi:hypothetical protein